jgi:hypothetical protein
MSPLLVLEARAEARALLFRCGEYEDSGDAVAPLLIYAEQCGLTAQLGPVNVLAVIHRAFEQAAPI